MIERSSRVLAAVLLSLSLDVRAESGQFNVSADLGIGAPLSGKYGTAVTSGYVAQAFGPALTLGVDYQVFRPLAIELIGDLWMQFVPSWLSIRNLEKLPPVVLAVGAGVGPRLRLLDTAKGNLWASLHVGVRALEGAQFAADAAVGYQFTVLPRLGLGPFARGEFLAPSAQSKRGGTFLVAIGVGASFELVPFVVPPVDDDGDGLSNELELNVTKTDPKKADTDGDALRDDVEVQGKTNPLDPDSDKDGVPDGVEDANHDGKVDPGESDPRAAPVIVKAPEPDGDGDGLPDAADACPTIAGTKTHSGCPDSDGDGLPDPADVCPTVAGTQQFDGCADSDGDGLADPSDACPAIAGLKQFEGCVDTDADGLADPSDNCPAVAGPADNQGCPKEKKQLVVITKEKLEILEKVYFNTRDASVQKKSFPLLDQVASVLVSHPEIKRVRIEGHTDDVGDPAKNLTLSQKRADAVRTYLSKKVDPSRLEAVGYGQTKPAAPNDSDAGREKNRRVEFKIVGEP